MTFGAGQRKAREKGGRQNESKGQRNKIREKERR